MVQTVMESVCILLGQKADWATSKGLLGDSNFLRNLISFDKDHIPEARIKKLKVYIDNPKFVPEEVAKVSKACRSLCLWARAIDIYARVFKEVEPKKAKLAQAEGELKIVMTELKAKQDKLAEVENQIKELQNQYEHSVSEKKKLEHSIGQTSSRLKRASKLTTALADEQVRWKESIEIFDRELEHVVGNVFVSAACVAYFGAFPSNYRQVLVKNWIEGTIVQIFLFIRDIYNFRFSFSKKLNYKIKFVISTQFVMKFSFLFIISDLNTYYLKKLIQIRGNFFKKYKC